MHSFSKVTSAAAAGLLLTAMQAAALTVNTPTQLTTCQPVLLAWSAGTAPYYPSIIPGGNPSGTPLKQFDSSSDESLTWVVDLAAGTSVTVAVTDSTGTIAYSAQVSILEGSDTSCLSSSTAASTVESGAAAATSAGETTAAAAATTSSGTKRQSSSSNVKSAAASTASTAEKAATTDDSSDASKLATGFAGLVGSALLAAVVF